MPQATHKSNNTQFNYKPEIFFMRKNTIVVTYYNTLIYKDKKYLQPRFRHDMAVVCCSINKEKKMRKLYRVDQVSELLGVSESTTWRWTNQGVFQSQNDLDIE